MPFTSHPQSGNNDEKRETNKEYAKGLEFLRKQKPREAIHHLERATKSNAHVQRAKIALEEALEGITWNTWYFCQNCGKLILPNAEYPLVNFDGFCPKCGEKTQTQKEALISMAEIGIKLFLFGIFPILVFVFCGMPNYQFIPEKGIVASEWNNLTDGIFMAAAFTPLMLLLMLAINDPWVLSKLNYYMFSWFEDPFYFLVGSLFLFLVAYLYFFLILTPIVAIHKRGYWKRKQHQKSILLYTAILFVLIMVSRIAFGVFR